MSKPRINKTITTKGGSNIFIPKEIIYKEYPEGSGESDSGNNDFVKLYIPKYCVFKETYQGTTSFTVYNNRLEGEPSPNLLMSVDYTNDNSNKNFCIYDEEEIEIIKKVGFVVDNEGALMTVADRLNQMKKLDMSKTTVPSYTTGFDVTKDYYYFQFGIM